MSHGTHAARPGAPAVAPSAPGPSPRARADTSRPAGALLRRAALPWRWLVRGRLSTRLIATLVLLVLLACAAVGAATYIVVGNSLLRNTESQLVAATSRYYAACLEHYNPPNGAAQNHETASLSPKPGGSLTDALGCGTITAQAEGTFGARLKDGTFTNQQIVMANCDLSAADKATLSKLPVYPTPASPIPLRPPTYSRELMSIGGDYQLTAIRGADGDVLFTGLPLKSMEHTLGDVELGEAIVFGVAALLIGVLGTVLVRLSLRPLRRVAATATRVTELPLDAGAVAMPAPVPDADPRTEVGQVGAAFNRMLGHVEAALARRAASESRLRRFAADASHELRTPLSAIRGYAELALRNHGPVPEEVTHALKRVESESARMSVLVDDLLLLARLDAGRPLARDPVDLTRLAIDTTSDAQVARNDHRWLLELPDEPVVVRGDEFRLHQVLANLLSNAGKHTPAGSTVTVTLSASGGQPWVELSVTDDGPGIPAALVPDLFERFVRADTARSHEAGSGSTGLGLAIVDAVVTAHRGSVGVTSRPGQTTFTIRLPRLEDEPEGQAPRGHRRRTGIRAAIGDAQ